MPLQAAPNLIEVTDFSGGWQPDPEPAAVPANGLLAAMNLLPDPGTATPQVRKGFKRLASIATGYTVGAVNKYERTNPSTGVIEYYLIVVVSNNVDNSADNVRVYSINLSSGAVTKLNGTGAFVSGDPRHFGVQIANTFYGGGPKDAIYSWDGTTYKTDPTGHTFKTMVVGSAGINLTTQVSDDKAFKKDEKVIWTDPVSAVTQSYRAVTDIRYRDWKTGRHYSKGDKVSRNADWFANGKKWYKSFKCTKGHDADSANRPGDGSGNPGRFWTQVTLDSPLNEDGIVAEDWTVIPAASKTNVATVFGHRLWLRYDTLGGEGKQRVQYSAVFTTPEKDKQALISQINWDPQDYSIGDDETGSNAGWLPDFPEPVVAIGNFGYYLCVFLRHQLWVQAGTDPYSSNLRQVGNTGTVGPRSWVEHDGLLYYLSDQGFYYTDGTQAAEVPSGERVRTYLRTVLDREADQDIVMWSHDGYVWMSFPARNSTHPNRTLVYDPKTKSFWMQDFGAIDAVVSRRQGIDYMFFAKPTAVGTLSTAVYAWASTAHRTTSTNTIGTRTNYCPAPDFELAGAEKTAKDVKANCGWIYSGVAGKHDYHITSEAAFEGGLGAYIKNKRSPTTSTVWGGMHITCADGGTGTHTFSAYVRKADWKKSKKLDATKVRFEVRGVAVSSHVFTYVGQGWYRVSGTYTGSLTPGTHQVASANGVELHVDNVMFENSASLGDYFDGDGGMGPGNATIGGETSLVYQYNEPTIQDAPSDDNGAGSYGTVPLRWHLRTAWFTFGALREDRRIRRVWALVRGSVDVLLRGHRQHSTDLAFESVATASPDAVTTYFEGAVMDDSYAVSVRVEGQGAPAGVLGVALDTQPRRVRYHVPGPTIS